MRTRWLCLEFTQTVGWRARDRADDALVDYGALVAWSGRVGALSAQESASLGGLAAEHSAVAARVLGQAVELRRASYRVFVAVGSGEPAPGADVGVLNRVLPEALAHRRLAPGHGVEFRWVWAPVAGPASLARPLWLVAESVAELLTSPELARLKVCEADDCGWLFVDGSRNRSRRWCDMSDCGNLAKVRRFRARRRAGGAGGGSGREPGRVGEPG